ncbi:MAG: glutathione S-transferase family protein [Blastomonas sp.]
MKLYWSRRSPFARKALLVAHEAGLAERIEVISIAIPQREPDPGLSEASPLQKLPTLITDDGDTIVDSPVICEYLDRLAGGGLFPDGRDRWRAMSLQAIGDELLSILLLWRAELRRPAELQSEKLIGAHAARLDRSLDWLEKQAEFSGEQPLHIGHITIGVLLSYLDFRFPERDWRTGRNRLAQWQDDFMQRPSALATGFSDQANARL